MDQELSQVINALPLHGRPVNRVLLAFTASVHFGEAPTEKLSAPDAHKTLLDMLYRGWITCREDAAALHLHVCGRADV